MQRVFDANKGVPRISFRRSLLLQWTMKLHVVTTTAGAQKAATMLATNVVEVASNPSFQPIHFCPPLSLSRC